MSRNVKKGLALFWILVSLLLLAFPLEVSAEKAKITVRYKSGADDSDLTASCLYQDSWFLETASWKYSKMIARVLAVGAASTYGEAGASKRFLKDAGYGSLESRYTGMSSEGTEEDNDNASYTFGVKTVRHGLGRADIIGVLISGYSSSGYEWKSNFNLGLTRTHRGFSLAEKKVFKELTAYIEANRKKGRTFRIWISGHSRGGAVANLLARDLNLVYGASKVFCYTFAPPAVKRMSSLQAKSVRNIFNLINRCDLVPYVPTRSMGYRRYGVTVPFIKSTYRSGKRGELQALQVSERKTFMTLLESMLGKTTLSEGISDSVYQMVAGVIGDSRVRNAHTMEAYLSFVMD